MTKKTEHIGFFTFIKKLFKKLVKTDVTGLAAQLSYFFLLSLFPLLIFLVSLLPYLPFTQHDLLNIIRDFAPGETMHIIESTLSEVMSNRKAGLLSFSIIATLWSASNGMNAVVKNLNLAYEVKETRPFFVTRSMSILLTMAMVFVLVIALLLPVFGKQLGFFLFSGFGLTEQFLKVWNGLRWAISPIILFIVFVGLYYFAPSKKLKCVSAFPGAIFATLGWVLTSLGFSYYVGNFGNYSATYGSIGGIIVLMVWLYLSGVIIMVGGHINALIQIEGDNSC